MPFSPSVTRRLASIVVAFPLLLLAMGLAASPAQARDCNITLSDSAGHQWDFDSEGEVVDGSDDAYDDYGFPYVGSNASDSDQSGYTNPDANGCSFEEGGREIVYPTDTDVHFPGVNLQRKVFVPASGPPFARWLDIVTNTSGSAVTFKLDWYGQYGVMTGVVGSADGDTVVDQGERWAAFELGGTDVASLWDGPGGNGWDRPYQDSETNIPGDDNEDTVDFMYDDVTVPAGGTVAFLHFEHQNETAAGALEFANAYNGGPLEFYEGMSLDEGDAVVNWKASDFDSDGVGNRGDNCVRGANADQLNTDGDGEGDVCDLDDDNDELTDEVELAIGTDPKNADTDADRVNDKADQCPREAGDQPNGCRSEDRPPTVTFGSPAENTRLNPASVNTLTATAADDRGISRVVFVDDGRVICTDTVAPYDCAYAPEGRDVGSNTLSAVAVDTTDQTSTAFRVVSLDRFTPRRLTARTTPKNDPAFPFRFITTGRVSLPERVTRAQGCKGRVAIQVKAAKNTISTRRASLTRTCTFRSRVTFRVPRKFYSRKLVVQVRFLGNAVLKAKRARNRFVTVG